MNQGKTFLKVCSLFPHIWAGDSLSPIRATRNKFDPSDENLDKVLESNRAWAKAVKEQEPEFFEQINLKQEPKILWIGKVSIDHKRVLYDKQKLIPYLFI